MTLMPIPPKTATNMRQALRRKVNVVDYDDLPRAALLFPSTGVYAWEATVTFDRLVTVRRVDTTRLDSLDEDIVNGDEVYNGYSQSSDPKELAKTMRRVWRSKKQEVAL